MIHFMKKFLLYLLTSLALAVVWLITAVAWQISPQSYLTLSAPLWHVALHVAFVIGLFLAGRHGMNLFWDWQSEQPAQLRPQQPPAPYKQ